MKKTVALILVFLMAVSLSACSLGNQVSTKYKLVDEGYALYRYKGLSTQKAFEVPDTYEGKPVTELMDFSLANAEYLETIHIGKNVKKINVWAMTNCQTLKEITVDADNEHFISVDGVLYSKDMTQLLFYPNGKMPLEMDQNDKSKVIGGGKVIVPDTVKEIRENAFYLCNNLYNIELPDELVKIGNKAFLKCGNLQKIEFPNKISDIGIDAFSYCNALKEIELPASIQSIGDFAFFSTEATIKKITIHKNSADEIQLGNDWTPSAKGGEVVIEYVGS